MNGTLLLYTLPLYFFALVSVISAVYLVAHLRSRLALAGGVALLGMSEVMFAYALEISLPGLDTKIWLNRIQAVGYAAIPVAWSIFILRFTGWSRWVTPGPVLMLSIIPVIMVFFSLLDQGFPLVVHIDGLVNGAGGPVLQTSLTPFGIFYLLYVRLVMIASFLLLFRMTLQARFLYVEQGLALMVCPLGWIIATYFVSSGLNFFAPYSPIPYTFAVSSLCAAWSIFGLRLGDVLPVAHEKVFDEMPDVVVIVDRHKQVIDLNRAATNLFRAEEKNVLGQPLEIMAPDLAAQVSLSPMMNGKGQSVELGNGILRQFDARVSFLLDNEGNPISAQIWLRDITTLKRVEDNLRRALHEAETLRQVGLALASELDLDQVLERVLQYLKQAVPFDRALVLLVENDGVRIGAIQGDALTAAEGLNRRLKNYLLAQQMSSQQETIRVPDVRSDSVHAPLCPVEAVSFMAVPLLHNQKLTGCLVLESRRPGQYDQAEQILAEAVASQAAIAIQNANLFQKVREQALTDPLTGVYNRRYFFEMANREIEQARQSGQELGLILMDLDHFKLVNDTYGHLAGDQVLAQLAQIMRQQVRSSDVICRYGGEEFAILLPEINIKGVIQVAERVHHEIFQARVKSRKGEVKVTVSMGVVMLDEQTAAIEDLLHQADRALYAAKLAGRNCVRYIPPGLNARIG
jgi:diguanylate cyclase (GGDEF)-like protein/PAS domain S-box-containing protein